MIDELLIDKINLIQISNDLSIPKETIRRKVNELQEANILKREGKTIIFNRKGIETQKPNDMIELLSIFIEKKSKMLHGKEWFGEHLEKDYIKAYKQIELANKYDSENHIFQGELTRIKFIVDDYDEENYTNYVVSKFNKLHQQEQKYLLVGHFFMFDDLHINIPANHKAYLDVDDKTLFSRRNGRLIKDIVKNKEFPYSS